MVVDVEDVEDVEDSAERSEGNRVWILRHRNEAHSITGFEISFHFYISEFWGLLQIRNLLSGMTHLQRQNAHTRRRGAIVGYRLGFNLGSSCEPATLGFYKFGVVPSG